MTPAAALRWILRESRGARGRLLFVAGCLAVGVAGVTGVRSLVAAIEGGVRSQSRELLAADLAVDGRRPLPPELDRVMAAVPGVERCDLRELATMVSLPAAEDGAPGRSRLAELKVVAGRYPFYGDLVLDPPLDPATGLGDDRVAAAPELLDALGAGVGSTVRVGGADFRVAARIVREPDRLGFAALLGPRLMLGAEGLERARLLGFGNRVRYRALFRVPGDPTPEALRALAGRIGREVPGAAYLRVETHHDAQPAMRRALDRFGSFLGLTALLSLLIGGVGTAQVIRTWIEGRTAEIAVLRCIGVTPRGVTLLFLAHAALLALAGSVAGALVGASLPFAAAAAAPELVPGGRVDAFQPAAALQGVALGVAVAVLFALPALAAVGRVPPARALRADAEPLPPPRAVRWGFAAVILLGVLGAALTQTARPAHALWFTGGLAAAALLLAAAASGATALARAVPRRRLPPTLVHGIAALARPGAGTRGAVIALGLGVLVVLGTWLVQSRLDRGLRAALPEAAPTVFLADVQPDQWRGVEGILRERGATAVDSVPVVMARIESVDGRSVPAVPGGEGQDGERGRWVLTREQRLTWRETLPADNRILEGALWSDRDRAEVSIEDGFARDLGVRVGSTLVMDVQGVPVELAVTSIRSVEWQSFGINFFMVVEPGVLDLAPHFRIASARVPEEAEGSVQDRLAASFPNVTMLRVRPIVEKVARMLDRVALAVRVLGSFSIAAGIAILAGVAAAGAARRGREAALLKVLGVTRSGVVSLFAVEFGLLGLVAGLVGAAGAFALAHAFLDAVLSFSPDLPLVALPLAALATAALAAAAGLAASTRALAARPVEALR